MCVCGGGGGGVVLVGVRLPGTNVQDHTHPREKYKHYHDITRYPGNISVEERYEQHSSTGSTQAVAVVTLSML